MYGLVAEGDGPRFDPSKVLLDPRATEVWFPPGHDRAPGGQPRRAATPGAARWPSPATRGRRARAAGRRRPPVVYEAHVRGLTRLAGGAAPGTYAALVDQLPRLAALGVTVSSCCRSTRTIPQEGSYWGYMPLAFGAVHRQYAAGDDAAGELADFVAAAHEHDIEVWLDVVFNHTTEVDARRPDVPPARPRRRDVLPPARRRVVHRDDRAAATTSTPSRPPPQDLVLWSLDRLADLGVDGFRFDLAAVLAARARFIARLDGVGRRARACA